MSVSARSRCFGDNGCKATAIVFILLLAGHDCTRIGDDIRIGAAFKGNLTTRPQSWWKFASPACAADCSAKSCKSKYLQKVDKLYEAMGRNSSVRNLREQGLRMRGLELCISAAKGNQGVLDMIVDPETGLKAVGAKAMHMLLAELRRDGVIDFPDKQACKVQFEFFETIENFQSWESASQEDAVSATRDALFGTDCDVEKYMATLSFTSRQLLEELELMLVQLGVQTPLHLTSLQIATEAAIDKAVNQLATPASDDEIALLEVDLGVQNLGHFLWTLIFIFLGVMILYYKAVLPDESLQLNDRDNADATRNAFELTERKEAAM